MIIDEFNKEVNKEVFEMISLELAKQPFFEKLQKAIEKNNIKIVLIVGNESDKKIFENALKDSFIKIINCELVFGVFSCKMKKLFEAEESSRVSFMGKEIENLNMYFYDLGK